MGGRGGGSGRGSRGGGRAPSHKTASAGLLKPVGTPGGADAPELHKAISEQIARVPKEIRDLLEDRGVRAMLVTAEKAREIAGKMADLANGFYWPEMKRVLIIVERFNADKKGRRLAGMTTLGELGHALDLNWTPGSKISESTEFWRALGKDLRNLDKMKMSPGQRARLTFQRYNPGQERVQEIFAEAFAVAYGVGRPTPAREWNNSKKFAKAYPNVIEFVKSLHHGPLHR